MSLNSRGNLSWNDDVATGWNRSNFYAIFSVNRYAYCLWLLHKFEAHMKGLPICFSEVQVKNDVTDNNNKHFVTAFEGECRNIIELREHLKLCFLIILYHFQDLIIQNGLNSNLAESKSKVLIWNISDRVCPLNLRVYVRWNMWNVSLSGISIYIIWNIWGG